MQLGWMLAGNRWALDGTAYWLPPEADTDAAGIPLWLPFSAFFELHTIKNAHWWGEGNHSSN